MFLVFLIFENVIIPIWLDEFQIGNPKKNIRISYIYPLHQNRT